MRTGGRRLAVQSNRSSVSNFRVLNRHQYQRNDGETCSHRTRLYYRYLHIPFVSCASYYYIHSGGGSGFLVMADNPEIRQSFIEIILTFSSFAFNRGVL